jgi:hypothetical protein
VQHMQKAMTLMNLQLANAISEVPIEFRLPAGRSYAALDC